MQKVSRFEASLLRLLYFFLRKEPLSRAKRELEARYDMPACLSPGAVRLIRTALAKGCVYELARRGAWRDEPFLRALKKTTGRLWQRTAPNQLGLLFSEQAMHFLLWITAVRLGDKQPAWTPNHDQLSTGDLLLLYFAHEGLREALDRVNTPTFCLQEPFQRHGLCWLAYPEDFTQVPEPVAASFVPWMESPRSCILEALQPELMARWIHVECSKERIEQPAAMRALGHSQERVLTQFLTACETANRRDLARFLLQAAHRLLGPHVDHRLWVSSLEMSGQRLADRAATYQAATSFLRCLERLAGWTRWARSVWRFDDEYPAAQLWLEDWEQHQGDQLVLRAQQIIRALDPMRQAQAQAAP